jgi:cholinesterase
LRTRRFFLSLYACSALAFAAQHQPYDRLYVFGDSYSDIGEGYLDGNGPTAVAYLAEHMGFKLKPFNISEVGGQSLDFAVSGARTGASAGSKVEGAWLGYGMQNQVDDFAALVGSDKIRFKPNKTLFYIAGGLNDGKLSTATTVANLTGEIELLYSLGARRFEVALLPIAIPGFSAVAKRLNPALAALPAQLVKDFPAAKITLSRWGPFFDEVMNSPGQYGIHNTSDACAGRAIFHQDTTECKSPDDHFFYHAGHPSTAVHKIVGEKLYRELLENGLN